MQYTLKKKNPKRGISTRGFTLMMASIVASIMLIIGSSMYSLAQKSVQLSSMGRDSQFAFYSADSASECALYYDVRQNYFDPASPTPPTAITCDKQTVAVTSAAGSTFLMSYSFEYNPNGFCSKVVVTKYATNPKTIISASGYNVRCETIATSERALERSVELRY